MKNHGCKSRMLGCAVDVVSVFASLLVVMAMVFTVYADTPDTFTWKGGTSGTWDAADAWTPVATSRIFPEIAGDLVVTTNGTAVTMANNFTVSGINVSGGSLSLLWSFQTLSARFK